VPVKVPDTVAATVGATVGAAGERNKRIPESSAIRGGATEFTTTANAPSTVKRGLLVADTVAVVGAVMAVKEPSDAIP